MALVRFEQASTLIELWARERAHLARHTVRAIDALHEILDFAEPEARALGDSDERKVLARSILELRDGRIREREILAGDPKAS